MPEIESKETAGAYGVIEPFLKRYLRKPKILKSRKLGNQDKRGSFLLHFCSTVRTWVQLNGPLEIRKGKPWDFQIKECESCQELLSENRDLKEALTQATVLTTAEEIAQQASDKNEPIFRFEFHIPSEDVRKYIATPNTDGCWFNVTIDIKTGKVITATVGRSELEANGRVCCSDMSADSSPKKNKNILNSSFTLPILSKLFSGYRPAQIADQLGVTPQAVKYHTDNMIEAGLIRKDKGNRIRWVIEDKGLFILKQKATGSIISFNNYQTKPVARVIPTRLDNLSFAFKVFNSIPEDPHLHWTEIKNGVSKCSLKYENCTIELVKSEKQGTDSTLLVHLDKKYCFDWCKELIKQYNLAIHYAKQIAIKFGLQISDYGRPSKRPHIAFEYDLIASSLAASYTSQIETRKGNDDYIAWIDRSNGAGELETNNPDYAYLYLMMPKTVDEIADALRQINKYIGYELFYHPLKTVNN